MNDMEREMDIQREKIKKDYREGIITREVYHQKKDEWEKIWGSSLWNGYYLYEDGKQIYRKYKSDSSSSFAKEAAEVVETEVEVSSEESETEVSDDFIFRDALDMPKVKEALSEVLTRKDKSGKLIFGQKNLVYVVYKFFMENDWLEKNNQTKFRKWMGNNFGEDFRCGKTHFDGIDKMYKNNSISQWKPTWTPYVTAAHALTERFMGNDNPQWEKAFLKPNRYIAHGTKKVK